ncbi:MAG: polysaccharide deacetylase family protein [Candidatus Omnitrophica bacterium]|nr:polysaccharide deacetylase family protein [Candidatus Omnitrophota bacterium]
MKRGLSGAFGLCGGACLWGRREAAHAGMRHPRIVLMYHGVSESPSFNSVPAKAFREHLSYLADHYRVSTLKDLCESFNSKGGGPQVSLSFDDAYTNLFAFGVPVLRKLGLPATVFVPAGHMGAANTWERVPGFEALNVAGAELLRQSDPKLLEIGSHGMNHIPLRGLSDADLHREVAESRARLSETLGREIRFFAYPYGRPWHQDARARAAVQAAGYLAACSSVWGRFNGESTRWAMRRLVIMPGDSWKDVAAKLKGWYDWTAVLEQYFRRGAGGTD